MDFTERLNKIVDYQASGDKKKFSKRTGIPYSTLVEYLNGTKKDPKLSFLKKIRNVSTLWLLTGEGDMIEQQPEVPMTAAQQAMLPKSLDAMVEEKIRKALQPIVDRVEQLEYEDRSDAYDRRSLEENFYELKAEVEKLIAAMKESGIKNTH